MIHILGPSGSKVRAFQSLCYAAHEIRLEHFSIFDGAVPGKLVKCLSSLRYIGTGIARNIGSL